MDVEQLLHHLQQCEPTACVALVEATGISELTGLVQPADRDVVLLTHVIAGLVTNVE